MRALRSTGLLLISLDGVYILFHRPRCLDVEVQVERPSPERGFEYKDISREWL